MPEPTVPQTFAWVDAPWGRALQCDPLAEVARHLFTTREPALPGRPHSDASGWTALALALGVAGSNLAVLDQVHGATVTTVPGEVATPRPDGTWADADAVVTDDPRYAVAVKAADCVPILMADRRTGAVAAVHAGWRGTAAAVCQAAVQRMTEVFGTAPADLIVAIGPSIGPCCYDVGTDVCDRFLEAGHRPDRLAEWFTMAPVVREAHVRGSRQPGKLWLDTARANVDLLIDTGVPASQICASGLCTACHADLFHSYRVGGAQAGRMAAAIRPSRGPSLRSRDDRPRY